MKKRKRKENDSFLIQLSIYNSIKLVYIYIYRNVCLYIFQQEEQKAYQGVYMNWNAQAFCQ